MKLEPKPLKVVCSNCGMDWEAHGEKPTVEKCVELLKAELARRPNLQWLGTSGAVAHPLTSYAGIPLRGNDIGEAQ